MRKAPILSLIVVVFWVEEVGCSWMLLIGVDDLCRREERDIELDRESMERVWMNGYDDKPWIECMEGMCIDVPS